MKSLLVGALIVVVGIGGCATKPKITEEEIRAAMTRTYKGVSSDQVMKASEKLLKMVDEKRFQFSRADNQLTATRSGQLQTNIGEEKLNRSRGPRAPRSIPFSLIVWITC
jgi:hypothetical protein